MMSGTRVEALSRMKIQGRVQRDLFRDAEDRLILQQARYWSNACSKQTKTRGPGRWTRDTPDRKSSGRTLSPITHAVVYMFVAVEAVPLIVGAFS